MGLIALIYAMWLLYAAGPKYLLSALLYAPGVFFFAQAKREQREPLFVAAERAIFGAVVAVALAAAYGLYAGELTL